MVTATQIINQALGELGVRATVQDVSGDDLSDCIGRLNAMIDSWRAQNLYAYAKGKVTATLPAGQATANIGTGELFNVERPFRLEDGCYYSLQSIDWPIKLITFKEYQQIGYKTQTGQGPQVVYYDPTLPSGSLSFWPTPYVNTSVTLAYLVRLSEFADLVTDYDLPHGYYRALFLSLAEELSASYDAPLSALTTRNAAAARMVIKRNNVEIPILLIDSRIPNGSNARSSYLYG